MSFTVYKSSAGSGKTYTLVKEYLKLTLSTEQHDQYKHILAITFTNKAANEMKERVLHALIQLSQQDDKAAELHESLAQSLGISSEDVTKRAEGVLKHILHHYADFAISTIDKFVHKIIRIFAFDLKLPMNFEVELDTKELLNKAIDELISKVGKDKQLTRTLLKYTEEKADAERSWHIEQDIEQFAHTLLKEEYEGYVQQLKNISLEQFFELRKKIYAALKEQEQKIKNVGEKGFRIIAESAVPLTSFANGKNGLPKFFEYWAELRLDKLVPGNTVQKNIDGNNWTSSKAPDTDKHAIEAIKAGLIVAYTEAQQIIDSELAEYIQLRLLYDNIYGLAVLNEIEKVIDQIKTENNILHISEFNKRIAEIVLNEPAPFIYERIGEKYSNYLVDEFQDTSELQWQNLLPLIDNALANGNFNMVVGDGKQAIYRWRGGEVEQFSLLPKLPEKFTHNKIVKEREDALIRNYNEQNLNTNYRSKANIVEFNNRFFKQLSDQLDTRYQNIYNEVEQQYLKSKSGGYISVNVLEAKDKEYYTEQTLHYILKYINEALSDGYQLQDIAILTRYNKEAILISDFLLQNAIKVISSESLLVNSSPKVKTIIAALQYIQDSTQVEAKMQLIKHICLNKETPLSHDILNNSIHDNEQFHSFLRENDFEINVSKLIHLPLLELLNELAKILLINPKTDSFVSQLFEFAFKQLSKKSVDIHSFLEDWNNKKDKLSITLSEGINAVSIMTIHKSKGLQFPVVIFPFAGWKIESRDKKHWVALENEAASGLPVGLLNHKKDLEQTRFAPLFEEENNKVLLDNINLLYVAFTRPEDKLHVISPDNNQTLAKYCLPVYEKQEGWDAEQQQLIIGEATLNKKQRKQSFNICHLAGVLPEKKKKEKLSVSYQYKDFWEEQESITGRKFGVVVHRILSKIKSERQLSDLRSIVERELSLSKTDQEKVFEYITALFSSETIQRAFEVSSGDKIYLERELLLSNGEVIRPDRVVVGNNGVRIIDFKTGEKQDKYKKQLMIYANAMQTMGYKNIESYILYTDTKELELV